MGLGLTALLVLWKVFPMSVEALTAQSSTKRAALAREQEAGVKGSRVRSLVAAKLPKVQQVFGPGTTFAQLMSLTKLRVSNIVREVPFWGILILMVGLSINNGHYAGRAGGQRVWPVTYLMLQSVEGGASLFFYIVATLYAAELVWRERDTRFAGIHDALPMRESTDWLSKFFALCFVELVLITAAGVCGILMQTIAGYYHYELLQYFKELYVITFPQILIFVLLAFFVQTVVSNKFIGHGVVIGLFVMQPILFSFGWENSLYLIGATPPYTYSDMNGYGHFVQPVLWGTVYWLSIAAFLAVISIALTRRGAEDSLKSRLRLGVQRLPRLAPVAGLFLLLAIGSGGWFYYNGHVLNEYLNGKARRNIQAGYEKDYKKYKLLPQPKLIAVEANVDIYPERRSFSGKGQFVLQNKTPGPITEIHITNANQSVTHVQFDRPFHMVSSSVRALYTIYALETPLAPSETVKMMFDVGHETRGFRDGNELAEFAYSGTFFDSGYFPTIGYDQNLELGDPRRRKEEKLGEQDLLPARGDARGSVTNLFTPASDWISYKTTVSTSDDQIALAPGYLQKEWHENGRHYFTYDMGAVKTLAARAASSKRTTAD